LAKFPPMRFGQLCFKFGADSNTISELPPHKVWATVLQSWLRFKYNWRTFPPWGLVNCASSLVQIQIQLAKFPPQGLVNCASTLGQIQIQLAKFPPMRFGQLCFICGINVYMCYVGCFFESEHQSCRHARMGLADEFNWYVRCFQTHILIVSWPKLFATNC
jgi:hypothetical protein